MCLSLSMCVCAVLVNMILYHRSSSSKVDFGKMFFGMNVTDESGKKNIQYHGNILALFLVECPFFIMYLFNCMFLSLRLIESVWTTEQYEGYITQWNAFQQQHIHFPIDLKVSLLTRFPSQQNKPSMIINLPSHEWDHNNYATINKSWLYNKQHK